MEGLGPGFLGLGLLDGTDLTTYNIGGLTLRLQIYPLNSGGACGVYEFCFSRVF